MEVPMPNMTESQPVLLATVICEDDARSNRDGSLLLQRVFYVRRPATLPARQAFVVVSLWWLRGAGRYAISTRVRDVDGGVLDELSSEVQCDGQAIHEQSARFANVEFAMAGRYRIEVLLDGEVAGAYPLFVESPVLPAPLPVGATEAVVETPIG